MNKLYLFVSLFLLINSAFSSTYLKTLINDQEQSSMVQGDFLTWEYDVSVVGGTALFSIYLDMDKSETLSDADIFVIELTQTDGVSDGDDVDLPDDSGEDGIITTSLGRFGFAPAQYILHVTDLNDNSEVSTPLFVSELSSVTIWARGTLTKEDVTSPDSSLANIMIFAEPDNMNMGFWSGLTDQAGNYTINFPDSASDAVWKISIEFENMIAGYINPDGYHNINLNTGENGPFDFFLERPNTYVYGNILDEHMNVINIYDEVTLVNLNSSQETSGDVVDGSFSIPAVFEGDDTLNVPFRLDMWGNGLIPDYLAPNSWDNPYYRFYLSLGDSLEKNITVYSTDTVIYVAVLQEGNPPEQSYTFYAQNDSLGITWENSDQNGFAVLSVRSGAQYYIWMRTEEDGQSLLPDGYIVKYGSSRTAEPGDTVLYEIIPAMSLLEGRLTIPDDQLELFNPEEAEVQLLNDNWVHLSSFPISADSFKFSIPAGNGGFYVKFNHYNNDFLAFPTARYVQVENDTIDTLRFDLSYATSRIHVKILNGPPNFWEEFVWMDITSNGRYPYVYQSFAQGFEDSTYNFKVCPAEWVIRPPYLGEDYQAVSNDTVLSVNPDSSDYYLEFVYQMTTGIVSENQIPQQFYVLQNYPNPFNPVTTIPLGLPSKMHVRIDVYNLAGQRVAQVLNTELPAGRHRIIFDGGNLASGLYFYRVVTPKSAVIKKLILIK